MLRRRWVRLILLLLMLAAAGGGYWLTQREPSPVLRTIVLPGAQPTLFDLDEGTSRFFFLTTGAHPLSILDTRTAEPVQLHGALGNSVGTPLIDRQSGHYFDGDATDSKFLMIDARTYAVLASIPFVGGMWDASEDTARDRILVTFRQASDVLVIDGHTGRVLHDLAGCTSPTGMVISRAANRLFELCSDNSLLVFDNQTYRQLTHRHDPHSTAGSCGFCSATVDEATQRLFIPANDGVSVLDARSGAPVRTLPIKTWAAGTLEFLRGSHDVVVVPYGDPASGPAARTVLILDGRTGAVAHRWAVPENPTQVLVNPLTGHVLVASAGPIDKAGEPLGYGTLSVVDAQSGATLRQVETGILPGAIAADDHTRHLFVVNFNTAMDSQLSPLSRRYPDGWWPQFQRRIKGLAGWLPFAAPQPPPPPGTVTVTMLDLSKL